MTLGHIRAKLMVADNDFTMTYMNPAVIELMREVEAGLHKELPHFSVDTLIGSNIVSGRCSHPCERLKRAAFVRIA